MVGLAPMLREGHPALLTDPWGKWAYQRFNSGLEGQQEVFANIVKLSTVKGISPFSSDETTISIWLDFIEKAETYNKPGQFTAMTGFEWTSTPKGNNLHRVVISLLPDLRDGLKKEESGSRGRKSSIFKKN